MNQFNLLDYLDEVYAISQNCGCTPATAVDRMIVNLNTFNEYHKGTGTLNYHNLSNLWGALTSAEKIAQKRKAISQVSEEVKPLRNRRRA